MIPARVDQAKNLSSATERCRKYGHYYSPAVYLHKQNKLLLSAGSIAEYFMFTF